MKKYLIYILFYIPLLFIGCNNKQQDNVINFAISAEYPPFEYYSNGKLVGFDVELAQLIAIELNKKIIFHDMKFGNIFVALKNQFVDAAISTITITTEREKNFDFSNPYYTESIVLVFNKSSPITNITQLPSKKIACQLGTTMEIWLKDNMNDFQIVIFDSTNQAIEALKAGHVDGVLIDDFQGKMFSQKNTELSYNLIAVSDRGYAIAINKDSDLKNKINIALASLKDRGELEKLKKKWTNLSQ